MRAPLIAAAGALLLYLPTLAPGLTWRAGGADGGDLITAAWNWGIPHPPGYPLYTLLGRLFLLIPWGDPAWRMNVLSALAGAGAAALVAGAVVDALRRDGPADRVAEVAGVGAGLSLAAAPLLWTQATITEVYAPLALGGAAVILLARRAMARLRAGERGGPPLLGLALVSGLLITHHLAGLIAVVAAWVMLTWAWLDLLVPSAVAVSPFLQAHAPPPERVAGRVRGPLLLFLAGLTPWLLLPLRAGSAPMSDWHHPADWAGFWALVSGSDYHGLLFHGTLAVMGERAATAALLLTVGAFGPALAWVALGWRRAWVGDRPWAVTGALAVVFTCAALAVYVADNTYVYGLAVLPIVAIRLGEGIGVWLAAGLTRPRLALVAALLVANVALGAVAWSWIDAQARTPAGQATSDAFLARMDTLPPHAVVLTAADDELFTLWYARYVTARRADLLPLSVQLLGAGWFRANLQTHAPDFAPALAGDPDFATLIGRAAATRPVVALRGDLAAPPGWRWLPAATGGYWTLSR
ncbi:MAG: DUF2723 domain-containing protein [Chloroflexota bacterium]|nr:DUF2723 domain-containing protein [Chloroflexota bacterium]